jgi:tetratricopeptide (TPR) repeat protein
MSRKKSAAIAGALGLICCALFWFIVRAGNAPQPSGTTSGATQTPAKQKAYLLAQLKDKPSQAPLLVRLALVERYLGENAEARQHLEQALAADANAMDARLELANLCRQTGDVAEAMKQYQAALRQDPHQADALYNLGLIASNGGDVEQARQYWTAAAEYGANRESGRMAAASLAKIDGAATPTGQTAP